MEAVKKGLQTALPVGGAVLLALGVAPEAVHEVKESVTAGVQAAEAVAEATQVEGGLDVKLTAGEAAVGVVVAAVAGFIRAVHHAVTSTSRPAG